MVQNNWIPRVTACRHAQHVLRHAFEVHDGSAHVVRQALAVLPLKPAPTPVERARKCKVAHCYPSSSIVEAKDGKHS